MRGWRCRPWRRSSSLSAVRFEKWQALGNDYVILEADQLPFELTAARVRRLCAAHTGVAADGVLVLSRTRAPGQVAAMRVFNPDGSEAEVSGNGARQAILFLRRNGWTDLDVFAIGAAAGELRARITSASSCTVGMGDARLSSSDYPTGRPSGGGELTAAGRTWSFQHVQVGNPQCSIRMESEAELEGLDLASIGPAIEHHGLFPNRTNVSWYAVLGRDRIRARIFERGVGETAASGTGAMGAAVSHVISGGESPVTVLLDGGELLVDVGDDLRLELTGWAVPVMRGQVADELVAELQEMGGQVASQ